MIAVKITPACLEIMQQLGIQDSQVLTTVNDRHRGLTDDSFMRIVAVHWFDDRIVMIESGITKRVAEGNRVRVDEVSVLLAILLRPSVPAGPITRDMEMPEILATVAQSFGHLVRCHRMQPYATLYGGPWDGAGPDIKITGSSGPALVCGTFSTVQNLAKLVWAFDLNRYLDWLSRQ